MCEREMVSHSTQDISQLYMDSLENDGGRSHHHRAKGREDMDDGVVGEDGMGEDQGIFDWFES